MTNFQGVFDQVMLLPRVTSIEDPFNDLMVLLPLWFPAVLIGLAIQWFVVRSAVLAALRIHDRSSPRND
ncbi:MULTISPECIES: hypothetical protein [Aeromicrobium]|uniref:hypothetical protein n=1 Tax=Aeromicrobium TaxID=2040 RepID=UPI0006F7A893|nr:MULTISPECIES: hypothetical protein [Aeromicrobium]KQX74601.1 hypothetical protein ASD10_05050 [Aeromicrobium sp. Root472D3]MCL8251625.1 hypothetical protein [Aeromicrobium fastidiosum]